MTLMHRLFGPRTCAGCGQKLIEWTSERINRGYRQQMDWIGCPQYRQLQGSLDWKEMDRHYAVWASGKQTKLADEPVTEVGDAAAD